MQALCALLAFVSLVRYVHGTSTSVRVAIPDLAGILYPQQMQSLVRFATDESPLPFVFETLPDGAALPTCDESILLCLDVVWTSAYETDAFSLASLSSNSAITSPTFDELASTAALIQPLIAGNATREPAASTILSARTPKTLWRFQTAASASTTPSIDLLFRLRQRSQTRAARDQLILHISGTRMDSYTKSASLEAFTVYGNQLVRHKTTHLRPNQMRMDIDIGRNESAPDVLLVDAYPLLPLSYAVGSSSDCDSCAQELEACRADTTCRLKTLPCVERVFAPMTQDKTNLDSVFGTYTIDFLTELATKCLANTTVASWNPIRRALVCAHLNQCAIDDRRTNTTDASTFIRLSGGSQTIAVPVDDVGRVAINVSMLSQPRDTPVLFEQTPDKLAAFLQDLALENTGNVTIFTTPYPDDPSKLQISIQYRDTLVANPRISTDAGVIILNENTPRAYVEAADPDAFSVAKMIAVLRSFSRLAVDVPPSATSHNWTLSRECLTCHARLYGCDESEVAANTCLYDNATSPLAECIRERFPRSTLANLMQDPVHPASLTATSAITECINQAVAAVGDSLEARARAHAALSCYASRRCPFGPVDLIQEDRMLRLSASRMLQVIRIHGKNFTIPLVFKLGTHDLGVAVMNTFNAFRALEAALARMEFLSLLVMDGFDDEIVWTMEIHHNGIVGSDLSVQIGANSTPPRPLIQHSVFYPITSLLVGWRDPEKVSHPQNDSSQNASASGSVDASADGSGDAGTDFGDQGPFFYLQRACERCDSFLQACGRSAYCKYSVAPCFRQALEQYTFSGIAEEFLIGSTGLSGANIQNLLHNCAQDGSTESRFDWWEGLQRWLGCYASYQCPTSRFSMSKSYLVFKPALITLETPTADAFDQGYVPLVQAQRGSGLRYSEVRAPSLDKFEELLSYMIQDISNVTINRTTTAEGRGRMEIEFDAPFLGDPPNVLYEDGFIHSVEGTDAKLYVVTESNSSVDGGWDMLAEKLTDSHLKTSYSSCDECVSEFQRLCESFKACRNYMSECVRSSVGIHDGATWLEDRSLNPVLVGCMRSFPLAVQYPMTMILACFKDLQCTTSGVTGGDPSFLRVASGGVRFPVMWSDAAFSITVLLPGESTPRSIGGTFEQIFFIVASQLENTARLELRTHKPVGTSFETIPVEFIFHDYVGELPKFYLYGIPLESWQPQVIVYGGATIGTHALTSALSPPSGSSECSSSCAEIFDSVQVGESVDALILYKTTLPCVSDVLENGVLTDINSSSVPSISTPNFASRLQTCVAPSWQRLTTVTKYFQCFVDSYCPVSPPSSNAMLVLATSYSLQLLQSMAFIDATLVSPIGSVEVSLSSDTDPAMTQWRLRSAMAFSSDVNVTLGTLFDGTREMAITYADYLGPLPSVSGSTPLVKEQSPTIKIVSTNTIVATTWSKLLDPIEQRLADNTTACAVCITSELNTCPLCRSIFLPSLLMAIEATAAAAGSLDLTTVFYNTLGLLSPSEWLPLARMFKCLAQSLCPVNSTSNPGSYLVVTPATIAITFPDQALSFLTLDPPRGLFDTTTSSSPTTDPVSEQDDFSLVKESIMRYLDQNLQSPAIAIAPRAQAPDVTSLTIDVTIREYFGWLPTVRSNFLASGTSTLPKITAHSAAGTEGVAIDGLVSTLNQQMPAATAAQLVPTDLCARCVSALFNCTLDSISAGWCTYTNSTSDVASCLRKKIPPSIYYGLSQTLNATFTISSALSDCFHSAMALDEAAGRASFRDDLWYATNEQLACFDYIGCAFGPLSESVTAATMVQLHAPTKLKQFTIYVAVFEAAFRTSFGFRVLTSDPFTHTANATELTTLLKSIMPESEVAVTITPLAGVDEGVQIAASFRFIYYPGFTLAIVSSDATLDIIDDTPDTTAQPMLKTVTRDATYLGAASTV